MTVKGTVAAVWAVTIAGMMAVGGPALARDADPVAAEVDGHTIRLSDVESARGLLPPQLQSQPLPVIYPMLLNSLINTHLAAEKAREMDLHQLPDYKKRMERIGEQILERMLLSRVIESQISEEQVKKRYEELRVQAETSFEVHARHILLKTPDAAELILGNLQSGADFASLAKQHSTGPSAPSGGDLGWFGPGDMVPEFEKAAMALKPGEYTKKPVETKFGWHIIKMEERRPLVIPSFEDARIAITNELSATAGNTLMDQMRKDADIKQIEWQDLK